MDNPFRERDWKYLRSIHDELLHRLCADINDHAARMASGSDGNPHERYLALYRYIQAADEIVADCFNDWRRSRLGITILALRRNHLLSDQQVQELSPEAQDWLRKVEAMGDDD